MTQKAVPPGARNDLDFLKEEADGDRYTYLRWGAVVVCAVVCGVVLFLLLRGNDQAPMVANAAEDGGPPVPQQSTPPPSAKLVSAPAFQEHRPDWWIQQWNSGQDIISNARGPGLSWSNQSPASRGNATVSTTVSVNSPVVLKNVVFSIVSLPGGEKRAVGRADIINGSDRNVLDYRAVLVWGPTDYDMIALQGTTKGLHQVYERALKPGNKMAVQLVSLKIKNHPDGPPTAIRLTSFLDGSPGIAEDDYPLQLGH